MAIGSSADNLCDDMKYQDLRNGRLYLEDCFDAMREIPDGVVDMVLCDLPYGTTQNKWDSIIPLAALWEQYWRIAKPNAAIVLTAQPPFDKQLGASCLDHMQYEWIWNKSRVTGHLNAKRQPMRKHENVLVFYRKQPTYNPQGLVRFDKIKKQGRDTTANYGAVKEGDYFQEWTNYPHSILEIQSAGSTVHPTQKPVALFEYLIKTYTNENELILDNCAGSGTTAIAAINVNRKWICIERDEDYANKAIERIRNHAT